MRGHRSRRSFVMWLMCRPAGDGNPTGAVVAVQLRQVGDSDKWLEFFQGVLLDTAGHAQV
jgi:hypothetical protein